jgi:MFS family permease
MEGMAAHPPLNKRFRLDVPIDLLLGAGGFAASISWQMVLPILPLRLSHLGYDLAQVGFLVSIFSLTMGIFELQTGLVVRKFGSRRTLIGGCLFNSFCLALTGTVRTTGMIASSLAASGLARAILVPPLHAAVADAAATTMQGRRFGTFWFCTSLGALAGPAIGGLVAARYGDRAPFYIGSAFSVVALPILATVAFSKPASPRPTVNIEGILGDEAVLPLHLTNLLCHCVRGIWTTFLPLYISHQGVSVSVIGWVFTVQGLVFTLMQIPTGRLLNQLRGEWLVAGGIAGMSGVVLLVPLLRGPPVFLVAGAVYGCAYGLVPVTLATLVTRQTPRDEYTTAMGVYNSAIDFGLFIGPLLGSAAALLNIVSPFFLALPLGLGAILISLVVRRH